MLGWECESERDHVCHTQMKAIQFVGTEQVGMALKGTD